ncbi:MAG: NAD-dependent epimerase/dehydratase family protein [Candidatus Hodarchaeota archaeon]
MSDICLVTGANGHLGNNLVRALVNRGEKVRASVRNVNYTEPFKTLDCEVVYADLLDRASLAKAMEGVDTLYQVAAAFKNWAKNPEKEIIHVNVEGTKNVLKVAAEQNVNKIVYVSSIAALNYSSIPMDETSWNTNFLSPYRQSKTESEKAAWNLAEKLNLWLVTVLPSAIIGSNCFGHLTPTMNFLDLILKNKVTIDVNLYFNYVDVRDVANGMITAAEKGRRGERYILGNDYPTSTVEVIRVAQSLFPNIKTPSRASKNSLILMAFLIELVSKITRKKPMLHLNQIKSFYGVEPRLNISKARRELGYNPKPPEEALKEVFMYLANREE